MPASVFFSGPTLSYAGSVSTLTARPDFLQKSAYHRPIYLPQEFLLKHYFLGLALFLYNVFVKGIESATNSNLFSNPYIFATQSHTSLIFQTMNSVRSNNLSSNYLSFALSGFKDIGSSKFEFGAKTQLVYCFEYLQIPHTVRHKAGLSYLLP